MVNWQREKSEITAICAKCEMPSASEEASSVCMCVCECVVCVCVCVCVCCAAMNLQLEIAEMENRVLLKLSESRGFKSGGKTNAVAAAR